MVKKLKLGGLVLALYPCNGDFIEFKSPKVRLISHALKKFSCWIVEMGRDGISFLIKYSIIKF
ncbi:hypothetical protein MPF98_04425 [Helicobacter pylori]|nr:hypothetical protein [Helicobacter pylori]UOR40166.1 hypothetical protein MPG11_04425 [Helicobacter pylori]UOS48861.1 hypothetical protein MPF98_04425 [Helicobacter pylori]